MFESLEMVFKHFVREIESCNVVKDEAELGDLKQGEFTVQGV